MKTIPPRAALTQTLSARRSLTFGRTATAEYYVDPVDTALLHVGALTDLSLNGERIFAYGEPFYWGQVLDILKKLRPGAKLPEYEDKGERETSTVDTELSLKILKSFGRDGFRGLEQSLEDLVHSLP